MLYSICCAANPHQSITVAETQHIHSLWHNNPTAVTAKAIHCNCY